MNMLDATALAAGTALLGRLRTGLDRVLLAQDELKDLVTIALCARGHVLLEGLPGLGKTELVKGLGALLGLPMRRVQFTPDLLPGDITGGPILHEENGARRLRFQPGPLFANLVLADEINRASPKTQSALLEAMQEQAVTAFGETHRLPSPFFVLATQNPIELEGTYPLPEAQLDRFLFKLEVPGVSAEVMAQILVQRRRGRGEDVATVLDAAELEQLFGFVDRVFLPKAVADHIARLVAATHPGDRSAPAEVRDFTAASVRYGASPRAAIALGEATRALALLRGRPNVDFKDVERLAVPTIAHRLVLRHEAALAGTTAAAVVRRLVAAVPATAGALPEVVR